MIKARNFPRNLVVKKNPEKKLKKRDNLLMLYQKML